MAAVNNTEVLKITATTKNAALSAELCNIMADVAPEVLIRVVGAGSVEKIGDAKIYEAAVSPSVTKNTAIGFAGGALQHYGRCGTGGSDPGGRCRLGGKDRGCQDL